MLASGYGAARLFVGMIKEPYLFPLVPGAGKRPSEEEIERTIDQAVAIFLDGLRADPRRALPRPGGSAPHAPCLRCPPTDRAP